MTVRWKPLLILSGLFVVVALVGLMTIATVMGSRGSADIVSRARSERKAKEYEKAKLDYLRALKQDGRNAVLHEELADLYDEWSRQSPPDKKSELRGLYQNALAATARYSPRPAGATRRLLAEAIRQDDSVEQVRRAKELASLEPGDRDARFVLAASELEAAAPNVPEVARHLKALDAETPRRARTEWVAARVAALANDGPRLDQILARSRSITLPDDADPTDRIALLRLRVIDVAHTPNPGGLAGPIEAVTRDAIAAAADPEIPSTRIARISLMIDEVQKSLLAMGQATPSAQDRLKAHLDTLDRAADRIFQRSLAVKTGADLNVYLAYADHLRFRDRRDRCLAIVLQGLKSPAGVKQAATETAMGLNALAVEATLANFADKGRYEVAAPHIKALLDCKHVQFQALGHLFQGAIDLEKGGMVADVPTESLSRAEQAKLRASALGHLKVAATQLPHLAEAQARYGVALILNQEPTMGRQYLQMAQRIGNLEPQYQIWAAWSVVQAGYPEDAEPIVTRMLGDVRAGRLPRSLEGTLHLLSGEIHQSRRSPADLKKAVEEYGRAFANGQDATPAVELRLAQIEVMLGRPADALKRIDWLVDKGKAGPAAENLAVLTLQELKRDPDSRKRLDAARSKFPESSELAVLDASLHVRAKKADQAETILADFLSRVPDNIPAVQQRAQILAENLGRPADARKLLRAVADRGENSAPLVQLALLELEAKDYEAVSASIAKIRQRWKDVATSDLLDAQLSLARGDIASASGHFDAALKKDPNNKIVQFYKAQLDGRVDPEGAARVFESLAHGESVKELDTGLSLVAASRSALASIALETGDLDSAISRYSEMLKDGTAAGFSRAVRWQIVAAQVAKKEWTAARAEIQALLADTQAKASPDEKVRAATYYRLNKEDAPALALCDEVLKVDPAYPGAVVTRAEILSRAKNPAEAIATVRRAIDASAAGGKKAPAVFYLLMAAVEATIPPASDGYGRALKALDRGLESTPDSIELVQAKGRVLTITRGEKAGVAFVEEKSREFPKGPFRRMLLTVYRDQGDFASAERVAAELLKETPTDATAAAMQVRMIAARSSEASGRGDRAEAKRLDDRAASLIYEYRARFKSDPTFTQLDCELEIRRGDFTRALALSQEVDAQARTSPVGPLLRSQIFQKKDQPREAAAALSEALARNPKLADARLQLARLSLKAGQNDEALRQAKFLQDADPDKPTGLAALLVEARAMASQTGNPAQVRANRDRAIGRLDGAIRARPDFAEAYYAMADIHLADDDRPRAVAALKAALKVNPEDATALGSAIRILAERRPKGEPAPQADLDEARALARTYGDGDARGGMMLAISLGLSRAGRPEDSLPWAEKAATKLGSNAARLNLGDLLLTISEAQPAAPSRQLLDRAVAEYDKILAANPNVIEAVNNKAWILHSYLGKSQAALELSQGLLQRVDPAGLPGEFFDTLGSIQEELGRPRDAEESYKKGLGKSPEHPVLNYHMGRLMAADKAKSGKAAGYLKVAQQGSDRLPAEMAGKLNSLLKQVGN